MKTVLIIGHGIPQPQSTGAGVYMQQLIELFLEWQCTVHFCSTADAPDAGILIDKKIPYAKIELNSDSFDAFIKELNPDIVVFDRFMTEEQYSWRVNENCPEAIRVLDTEDLHFLRAHREKSHSLTPPFELSEIAKRELASIFRSDLSLIISASEFHILTQYYAVPESALFHLPFLIKQVPDFGALPTFDDRSDLCFVGTGMHKPNVDAIRQLARIWPKIRAELPDVKIHVYGSYFKDDILKLNDPANGFIIVGFVDDLNECLRSHRLLVAPLRFGAGQKRKIFDAWLSGCPVVTTEIGAEGMASANKFGGAISNDADDDFVKHSIQLYQNPTAWKRAQTNAKVVMESTYNWSKGSSAFNTEVIFRDLGRAVYRQQNPVGQILWHQSLQSSKYLSKWIQEKNKK